MIPLIGFSMVDFGGRGQWQSGSVLVLYFDLITGRDS